VSFLDGGYFVCPFNGFVPSMALEVSSEVIALSRIGIFAPIS
jgi:hypothetical protein